MHAEAYGFIARHVPPAARRVLDIGGRDINGTPRGLFNGAEYTVLDQLADAGVDIVADAASWRPAPGELWDVVVCCEVLEHTPAWREILATAHAVCEPGGWLLVTAAGPARAPHSAYDGAGVRPDEHYGNIEPLLLASALLAAGWAQLELEEERAGQDVYALARRPL